MAHKRWPVSRTASAIALLLIEMIPIACSSKTKPTQPPPPKSTCLQVPVEYPTIRAAIDAAIDGDTIRIVKGRYRGYGNTNLDPLGKAILITGEDDPDSTIIDCRLDDGRSRNGFVISRGEGRDTKIRRLTITGSGNGSDGSGIALACRHASPSFWYCVIRGNGGLVVYLRYSGAEFFGCRIERNLTDTREPTIWCLESAPRFEACEISSNLTWEKPAVLCEKGCIEFDECLLEHNVNAHGEGGAIRLERSTAYVLGTTIARNACGVGSGGAVTLHNGSSLDLDLSTIAENMAEYSGGAIMAYGFTVVEILRSIVWANCAPDYSAIEAATASSVVIGASAMDTSRVGGGGQFVYRGQLVTADPLFCRESGCGSALESDYHLQPGSPCAGEQRMGALQTGCEAVARR